MKKSNFYKKLMKGRFYKNGRGEGGRGIFSVFPIKNSFLLSTNDGVEKDSWIMNRKSAPHLQKYTAHCHYAPAVSATSMPFHKCPISLAQLWHSSNSSVKITRKVFPGCLKKPDYYTNTFQRWEETTGTPYLLFNSTRIKQKSRD